MAPTTRARTRAARGGEQAGEQAGAGAAAAGVPVTLPVPDQPGPGPKRGAKRVKGKKVAPQGGVDLASKSFSINGPIASLPHELLFHIIRELVKDSTEGAKSALLFLSCSKALYSFSLANREVLFHDLYHAFVKAQGYYIVPQSCHPLYSPKLLKKGAAATETNSIYDVLPKEAIFDWRAQYIGMVQYDSGNCCINCGITHEKTPLVVHRLWALRLCLHCSAMLLVTKSNLDKFNVTAVDVGNLQVWDTRAKTSPMVGRSHPEGHKVALYSGFQLQALALQKHGEHLETRNKKNQKKESTDSRRAVVLAYFLLHCGMVYTPSSLKSLECYFSEGVQAGWWSLEFQHAISRSSFTKPRQTMRFEVQVEAKGPYPTKVKTVEALIEEFHEKVVRPVLAGRSKISFFRPADQPGDVLPSTQAVDACQRLWSAVSDKHLEPCLQWAKDVHTIRALQDFVQTADDTKLVSALEMVEKKHRQMLDSIDDCLRRAADEPTRSQTPTEDDQAPSTSSNNGDSANDEAAGKSKRNKPDAEAPETSASKAASKPMTSQGHVGNEGSCELAKPTECRQVAPQSVKEAVKPVTEADIEFEEGKVRAIAEGYKIPMEAARKKRNDRINSMVRAVAIQEAANGSTCWGGVRQYQHELTWGVRWEEEDLGLFDLFGDFLEPPYGSEYVNACTPNPNDTTNAICLRPKYSAIVSSRINRVFLALPARNREDESFWSSSMDVRELSGAYLRYITCPARDLTLRTKVSIDDVTVELRKIIEDCRADRITCIGRPYCICQGKACWKRYSGNATAS